jgi:D-alanyl-D-alanine carboxypeptidase
MLHLISFFLTLAFIGSKAQFLALETINIGCTNFQYINASWNFSFIPHMIEEAFYETQLYVAEVETLFGLPSVSFGVVYNQHLVHYHGSGRANITNATSQPNMNTIYRIGQLTKVFTSLLTYIMRDKGYVTIDGPLHRYNPGFSIFNPWGMDEAERRGETITIQQLLSEVSGLPLEAPCINGTANYICNITTNEVLEIISHFTTIHPTDVQASQSNLAYGLLGNIIPGLADLDYEEAVHSMIINPMGLANTGLYINTAQKGHSAIGYNFERQEQPWTNLGWAAPSGQMFSSVHDISHIMAQFFEAIPGLYTQNYNSDPSFPYITGTQTLREILRPIILNPDKQSGLGAPWEIQQVQNFWPRVKIGNVAGFSSSIALVPELRLGVVAFTNTDIDASVLTLGPLEILIPAFQSWLNYAQAEFHPILPKFASNAAGDYYVDGYFAFALELAHLNGHEWLMLYDLHAGQYGTLLPYNTTENNDDRYMFYKSLEFNTQSCWDYVLTALDGDTIIFQVNTATNEVAGAVLPDNFYGTQFNHHAPSSTGTYFRKEKTDVKKRSKHRMPQKNSIFGKKK